MLSEHIPKHRFTSNSIDGQRRSLLITLIKRRSTVDGYISIYLKLEKDRQTDQHTNKTEVEIERQDTLYLSFFHLWING